MTIAAIQSVDLAMPQAPVRVTNALTAAPVSTFTELLTQGIDAANAQVTRADRLVAAAALNPSLPLHQVTFALEEARISLELLVQVRNRLIDASQQLLNMQL